MNVKMKNKIIFFGGTGTNKDFGGELTKNKEIIARLCELGCNVTVIDSYKSRASKTKLLKVCLKFFASVLTYPKATYIFSTSFGNTYPLLKILYRLPHKLHIAYWVIGGNLAERIVEGAYDRKYLKIVSLFIVEGTQMKQRMAEAGFDNVLYRPNFKTVGKLPTIKKANDGKIHFYFLSRIMPDKGCRYILQSVEALNRKDLSDRYVVDFYGGVDDDYKAEFNKEVNRYSNVNYCGSLQLQDERNYEVLAKYHYMLFPTYWIGEGFPGVVIDAYKAGTPIIGSDWNLNSEFIKDGKTGIVVPTHSVQRLTDAMEDVILGKCNTDEMSANCQKELEKFNTKYVVNESLVESIIKK